MRYRARNNTRHKVTRDEAGFTMVELLIATAVFSLVLLICSMAIVQVGRMYYKGVITNRTQDTSRQVIEDIASAIQFGSETEATQFYESVAPADIGGNMVGVICVGGSRYTYVTNRPLGQVAHVLWKDPRPGTCTPANVASASLSGGQELLGTNMRLPTGIAVSQLADSTGRWAVTLRVAYGETVDLFEGGNPAQPCRGTNAGGQFCAVSDLSTSVIRRL